MIAAALVFLSFVTGIAATLIFAMWFSTRPKTTAPKPQNECNVAALGGTSVEAYDAYLLKRILAEVDKQTLYEIRPRIQ
jgi:hypothetical protein